jgi:hypothetical protein
MRHEKKNMKKAKKQPKPILAVSRREQQELPPIQAPRKI